MSDAVAAAAAAIGVPATRFARWRAALGAAAAASAASTGTGTLGVWVERPRLRLGAAWPADDAALRAVHAADAARGPAVAAQARRLPSSLSDQPDRAPRLWLEAGPRGELAVAITEAGSRPFDRVVGRMIAERRIERGAADALRRAASVLGASPVVYQSDAATAPSLATWELGFAPLPGLAGARLLAGAGTLAGLIGIAAEQARAVARTAALLLHPGVAAVHLCGAADELFPRVGISWRAPPRPAVHLALTALFGAAAAERARAAVGANPVAQLVLWIGEQPDARLDVHAELGGDDAAAGASAGAGASASAGASAGADAGVDAGAAPAEAAQLQLHRYAFLGAVEPLLRRWPLAARGALRDAVDRTAIAAVDGADDRERAAHARATARAFFARWQPDLPPRPVAASTSNDPGGATLAPHVAGAANPASSLPLPRARARVEVPPGGAPAVRTLAHLLGALGPSLALRVWQSSLIRDDAAISRV